MNMLSKDVLSKDYVFSLHTKTGSDSEEVQTYHDCRIVRYYPEKTGLLKSKEESAQILETVDRESIVLWEILLPILDRKVVVNTTILRKILECSEDSEEKERIVVDLEKHSKLNFNYKSKSQNYFLISPNICVKLPTPDKKDTNLRPKVAIVNGKKIFVQIKLRFKCKRSNFIPAIIGSKELSVFVNCNYKTETTSNAICHAYKSDTPSSRRSQLVNDSINDSTESWFHNLRIKQSYLDIKEIMFDNKNDGDLINHRLSNLIFSAKIEIDKEELLEPPSKYNIESIPMNIDMRVIRTTKGFLCFNKGIFVCLLIPRKESLKSIQPKKFLNSMIKLSKLEKKGHNPRGGGKHVTYEKEVTNYVTLGITSKRFGKGLYEKELKKTHTLNGNYGLRKFTNQVRDMCIKYIPSQLMRRLNKALSETNIPSFRSYISRNENNVTETKNPGGEQHNILPSIAFGANTILPMHTDDDAFLSVVSVHCKDDVLKDKNSYKENLNVSKYFVFCNKISVGLRSGDILIFNPGIGHCISTLTDPYRDKDVFCVSHYFKSVLVSLNDNSIPFEPNCN